MTAAGVTAPVLRRLDRKALQPFLPQLSAWLLPGSVYPLQHTWPQLYRSDGRGSFYALFDGERLISHLALRPVTVHGAHARIRAALIGSVATAPHEQGRGHASRLLREALADGREQGCDLALLWAGRPELYARAGFAPGPTELSLCLAASDPPMDGVRLATIADHAELHRLHEQKPLRVLRSAGEHSGLLTTPGMNVMVLERAGKPVAYACCGKGADLQGWWHELGGSDEDVAVLLPSAMALLGQAQALAIVPPYRERLRALLGAAVREELTIDGPMVLPFHATGTQPFFVDGLDSV
jgi:GNAT superfamily N-acetyltransferase